MVSWRLCCYLEINWLNGMAASWRCKFSSRMSHSLMMRPFDCSIKVSCMVTTFSTEISCLGGQIAYAVCFCWLPPCPGILKIGSYKRQNPFGAVNILDIESHS